MICLIIIFIFLGLLLLASLVAPFVALYRKKRFGDAFKSEWRGERGEEFVKWVIRKTKMGEHYVLNNLFLRRFDGRTTQIDHLVINRKGVFVIETKNYSGRIYGKETQREWTQVLRYGKIKNRFYNPVKQNMGHIHHVAELLPRRTPIVSAVVFVKGNTKYIESSGIYTPYGLTLLLRNGEERLSSEEMKNIHSILCKANDTNVTMTEHVERIHEMQEGLQRNICPRCGKRLVERQGKTGRFMGCSGYPSCKFTKNITE